MRSQIFNAKRAEGMRQAERLISASSSIWTAMSSIYYWDKQNYFDSRIDMAVQDGDLVLKEIFSLSNDHPQRVAFFEKLNKHLFMTEGAYERFESSRIGSVMLPVRHMLSQGVETARLILEFLGMAGCQRV